MKVTINANSIQQVLNADVINMEKVKALSAQEKGELVDTIIKNIAKQAQLLQKSPDAISSASIMKIAEKTNRDINDIVTNPEDIESKKLHIKNILDNLKNYLGSTSDILFNAVKIAQLLGIG